MDNKIIDRLISETTGNIIEIREGDTLQKRTKEQDLIIENKKKAKLFRNEENGFVWMLYNYCDKLNLDIEGIERSDIPKITYISTFINYEGYLVNYNKSIDKNMLKKILNINKNTFYEFYNKMIELEIFTEIDNKIKVNENFFKKGKISENNINSDFTRIYIGTVRYLYENVSPKYHDMLGIYFKLIPYVHRQMNIICYEPESKYEDIIPLRAQELSDLLGYRNSIGVFIREMLKVRLKNGESIVSFVRNTVDEGGSKMFMNPKVVYGGTHYLIPDNLLEFESKFIE